MNNSGENNMDEKKANLMEERKRGEETETSGGVVDKMLAMQRDDGYGSSNSSPHSAGKIHNFFKN